MPNPKAGTVTMDVTKVVRDIKSAARVEYRVEKAGIIHMPIGKVSFPTEHLVSNFQALLSALLKAKPATSKGRYLRDITVSSTMGPGVRIDTQRAHVMGERGV
jgi:large subunit ribosomal protein L1